MPTLAAMTSLGYATFNRITKVDAHEAPEMPPINGRDPTHSTLMHIVDNLELCEWLLENEKAVRAAMAVCKMVKNFGTNEPHKIP